MFFNCSLFQRKLIYNQSIYWFKFNRGRNQVGEIKKVCFSIAIYRLRLCIFKNRIKRKALIKKEFKMITRKLSLRESVLYFDEVYVDLVTFESIYSTYYCVYTASSTKDAFQILKTADIKVVVVNQETLKNEGIVFLEKMKCLYPAKIRIAVISPLEPDFILEAVNRGGVYKIIDNLKNEGLVKSLINEAITYYNEKESEDETTVISNNQMDKFMCSLSHDLRAPLMSILGITNLAKLDVTDKKSLGYFALIKQMATKLDEHIYQVIDQYKKRNDSLFVDEVDFKKFISEIVESIKYHPKAKNVKFEIVVEQSIPFKSSKIELKAILSNLISNAFKYQRVEELNKKVLVTVLVTNTEATIKVTDNGIGIKESKKEEVFNLFYRDQEDQSGTGVGLFVVKNSVNKLAGQITLNSEYGKGTEVILTLPSP